MTRTYVLTNHKGGVGKSTSVTNIALGMAAVLRQAKAKNSKGLLIDTDSQAHAMLVTTGRNDYGTQDSLYTVLMADRQNATQTLLNCIVPSAWDEDLHVLPGSPLLEQAERELQGTAGAPYRIADPLAKIASGYAAIVIDTRPSFSLMTEMALIASTDAIIPIEPHYLETVGLLSVITKINEIREGWRIPNLRVGGILVTKMDKRVKGHHHLLNEIKSHPMLGKLLMGIIPMNVTSAHLYAAWLVAKDPECKGTTISRDLLCDLWQVSVPTLLSWEDIVGISKQANFAQSNETSLEHVPAHAYLTLNRDGSTASAWRLSNTYFVNNKSIQQQSHTGKASHVRQAVRSEIALAEQRGSIGDVALPRSAKRYFTDHTSDKLDAFQACDRYFQKLRKLSRKGGDIFERRYFYVGSRHGVRIYEPFNLETNAQATNIFQQLIWQEHINATFIAVQ